MIRRLQAFAILFIFVLASSTFVDAQAQFFSDEEFGGSATCRLSGEVSGFKRKIKASGDNFISISDDNVIEFEFEGDTGFRGDDISLLLTVPLLGTDTDLFFSSDAYAEENDEIEFSVIREKSDEDIEITNLADEEDLANPSVLVQIVKLKDKKASGIVKVRFPETVLITDDGFNDVEEPHGKVVVTCKFSNVPAFLD